MIGCYIHHQGSGHLHRALSWAGLWARRRDEPVTGLSSAPAPPKWPGPWIHLPSDAPSQAPREPATGGLGDPTAGGALHWVPTRHAGLRRRMAMISAWIDQTAPALLVVDISVEVTLIARLHGVPVVVVALPGDRRDPAHQLGYQLSEAVVGFWPREAEGLLQRDDAGPATQPLGGLCRFSPAVQTATPRTPVPGLRIAVLSGRGGGGIPAPAVAALRRGCPEAQVTVLGGTAAWREDPWPVLHAADFVVTAAGQNAVAEVAASRTPAVVMPQQRPHGEQHHLAEVLLRGSWPAVPAPRTDTPAAWRESVHQAAGLDASCWQHWTDGQAAVRFIELLDREIRP
ncbi:hypothetical protein [Nesterenkonia alba]|uniref:hypothetical protein n=1 Tax=Nesterenkonia alba TaxID=515814 RepID=UPI0003B3B5DF|nr:hypothetical protein [Nesterenkonia alba]